LLNGARRTATSLKLLAIASPKSHFSRFGNHPDLESRLTLHEKRVLGFEVTRAASAAAALGALANGRKVDLVFSDIMMPGGMNGVELAREIRSRRSDLPVLLTSGYAEAARRSADEAGLRVLPKPYGLTELASALRAAMSRDSQREDEYSHSI
jgi:CheY-like chemotaxis protein